MKSRQVVFLVDACFSGELFRRGRSPAKKNRLSHWRWPREGRVVQIMSAGRATETVLEFNGWGAFTRVLYGGLLGAADANEDGVVTFLELGTYVQGRVFASEARSEPRRAETGGPDSLGPGTR